MKALSLWEPWATAIALGLKRIETRGWSPTYRGPLAIHAAKMKQSRKDDWDIAYFWEVSMDDRDRDVFAEAGYSSWKQLPFGCVVATCRLDEVHSTENLHHHDWISSLEERWGNYGRQRFGWMLEDVHRLKEPIPARGFQQLWDWSCGDGVTQLGDSMLPDALRRDSLTGGY